MASLSHFFKIILDDGSRVTKLRIPKKFVRKYGEDLSNPVCLMLPSGSEWEVELKRSDGEVWFEKGWAEFSEFCSLDYKYLLVFGYEGNSKFKVCIFDKSAMEIDYPPTMVDVEETQNKEDDHSVEILEDFPPCPKTRQKSPLTCPPPQKKRRTSSSSREDTNINLHNVVPRRNSEMKREDLPIKRGGGRSSTQRFLNQTHDQVLGRMCPLISSDKAIALERANIALKSENPSFKISLKPSYIRSYLYLPSHFTKRHLIKQPAGNAFLRVANGTKTWSVKFKYESLKARFKYGWRAFVRDNNLKVGNVCVFTLIKGTKLLFEVVFFATMKAANCLLLPGNERGAIDLVEKKRSPIIKVESDCTINCQIGMSSSFDPSLAIEGSGGLSLGKHKMSKLGFRDLEAANKLVLKNPSFRVSFRSSHLVHVSVPSSFAKSFIKEQKQAVTLQVRDRSWPVNLIRNVKSLSAQFSGGWSAFCKENCLRIGDVCIFELIHRNDIVLEVHIFRRGLSKVKEVC